MSLQAEVAVAESEVEPGAELGGVGGDGEVALDAQLRDRGVYDVDRDPPRHRDRQRRWLEGRVEAADAEHEVGLVAEGGEHRDLALDGQPQHARVHERGEEVDAGLVELDRADEVDLQDEDRQLVGGQRDPQHADDGDVAGDLDDDGEGQADDRRRPPSQLGHRADEEDALLRGEERPQVAEDARGVGDDVGREHHRRDRVALHALH